MSTEPDANVTLRFEPVADHVRTARLVAAAVARRAGVDESRLDEVRLAVGEACARAVRRCQAHGVVSPIVVEIDDLGPVFVVVVTDDAPADDEDEPVAVAMVHRLADEAGVMPGPAGPSGALRLVWQRGRTEPRAAAR